ncbi:MAG: IS200/IS605 family transposase, partial [Candidatus Moranbacteria bacterium]|nr:IS200/IS605 family transposase [Candidatus Moranbacteria bacterium]NTW13781.1 IS200/IS605 family transposase [Candidatus Moranbacteria bacterium]NTW14220.1 IS200/IS605 family transposase [Candidatus Moranbacteria bacterium]
MSLYLHKSHNVSCLVYHIVCPIKYRRVVISELVDQTIKDTCLDIAKRYDIHFLEIGTDKD